MRPLVLIAFIALIFCGVFWIAGQDMPFFSSSGETVASSTASSGGILPSSSGIRGKVILGPPCPGVSAADNSTCLDRPYETAVHVYRSGSSNLYALGKSDAKGNFEFSMPPGSYTVTAQGGKVLPDCTPVPVLVEAAGYSSTTISCDTGIR